MRGTTSLIIAVVSLSGSLAGQATSPAPEIRIGDSLYTALKPVGALAHYRAALAVDSTNYEALWKSGRELVDIAKQIEGMDDASKRARDSLYTLAQAAGEAAVRVNPRGADGHFTVGQALGRLSRTKSGKERVRYAKLIYDEGMKAIALDSAHDGAYHLVGAWHAEVKRLSWIQRKAAAILFGGGFLSVGNWADAQRYLERAVALRPQNIFHHLELAEIYVDVGKYSLARGQLQLVHDLPIGDVLDHEYKTRAAALLDDIKNEKDE
jgi:tetratricopeptide (TPR) repeat protein